MRSIIRIPLLGCFAVLALMAFVECFVSCTAEVRTSNEIPDLKHKPHHSPMLAGQDTPVWIADRPDPSKPVIYTKLESGIVMDALEYWRTKKSSDGFPIRQSRTFQDNHTKQPVSIERPDATNSSFPTMVNEVENEVLGLTILYPSLLLVMDYDYFLPMTKENEKTVIKERILYALAFWNSVAFTLRKNIEWPRINLRIVGIVITRNRSASPYINNSEYYYSLVDSLKPMIEYWAHDANNAKNSNNDRGIPLGTYDIVAHMTDSHPYREAGYKMYPGIASTSNPCSIEYGLSGVIVYDDLAFLGIHTAVEKMTNVFGDNSISWKQYTYDRKEWTPTTLANIRKGLKDADCMSAPKEYFPPGWPIVPPLAGDLLPRAKQCAAHGFSNHTYHCWTPDFWGAVTSTCKNLKCSDSFTSISCRYSNPTLDGTFCSIDNKKICMDGECLWAQ